MSEWERIGDLVATLAVASLTWISGAVAPGLPAEFPPTNGSMPVENQSSSIMRWAQEAEEPPIEQVGEETDEDVEPLDDTAPIADETDAATEDLDAAEDVELLDDGPPAGAQDDDVELLDQGPPLATTDAPATVATAPVTTYVEPVVQSGPVIPEGFGTGDVHAAAGSAGFPIGLADCHVGAVTGRAYVGIECGDEGGTSFAGHAPGFDEFPFVTDEGFPFGQESIFADRGDNPIADQVQALIAEAHGAPSGDAASEPEIWTSGPSTVEFEQRARDRKPRVEAEKRRAKRAKNAGQNDDSTVTASQSADEGNQASTESKKKKKKRAKQPSNKDSAGVEAESEDSEAKKQRAKKGKKRRAST